VYKRQVSDNMKTYFISRHEALNPLSNGAMSQTGGWIGCEQADDS